jgi:predicted nucleotidyltransferase
MPRDEDVDQVDDGQLTAIGAHIGRQLPHLSVQEAHDLAWAVGRLIESFHPESIYVFGSHARGTPGPNSDIDLMVVVADTDQSLHRLDQQGYGLLEPYRLPIELVFITRADFERRLRAVASLPASVAREGRLLYAA